MMRLFPTATPGLNRVIVYGGDGVEGHAAAEGFEAPWDNLP